MRATEGRGAGAAARARARRSPLRWRSAFRASDELRFKELNGSYAILFKELAIEVRWKHRLPPEDAEDVVQEAFVVLLERTGPLKDTRAWLEGVVERLVLNFNRKRGRRATLLAYWGPDAARARPGKEED